MILNDVFKSGPYKWSLYKWVINCFSALKFLSQALLLVL